MNEIVQQEINISRINCFGQVFVILLIQVSYSTAFAVFYSGLSLYLTHNRNFTHQLAASLTGIFLSINYFLPLVGGAIANRYISYKNLFCLGMFFSFTGCLMLLKDNLYLGLSLFLMAGLSNICPDIFLTQLFSETQKIQRRIAFVWNYAGMNLGFMLGYFLTGVSTLSNYYYDLFFLMSFLMILSLFISIFFINEPILNNKIRTSFLRQIILGTVIILLLFSIITVLLYYANYLYEAITYITILFIIGLMFFILKSSKKTNKNYVIKFIFFMIFATVFWAFYMLTPVAIMQLIENNVERTYFTLTIAPQWLANINSIIILIFAPMLTLIIKSKIFNNSENYFTVGFIFLLSAFLLMAFGIHRASDHNKISALIIIGYLILFAFGEIFISPISDSFVGEYIQESLRGIMTGVSRITICIGVLLAGLIANKFINPYIHKNSLLHPNNLKLEQFFIICGFITFIIAFTIPLISSIIRKFSVVNLEDTSIA